MRKTFTLIIRSCALLIALAGIQNINAQTPKPSIDLSFEQKVPGWLRETNVPAAGIGIIENGKLKYIKVFGELKKGTPAPANTIFQVASLTKPIVEILTLQMVLAG